MKDFTIMSTLSTFWKKYQQYGINENLNTLEARYITALNGMVLIVTGLLWAQIPFAVALLPESLYILLSFLVWPLFWQLIPYLNHKGKYTAARLLFSFSTLVLITFDAIQLGPVTENHLFMLSVFVGGFIIYPPKERKWLIVVVILSAIALVCLEWFYRNFGALVQFPADSVEIARWSSMSALFFILLGITAYHYQVLSETENKLEAERERSESLLLKILPSPIAQRLKNNENPIADKVENATILFADLVGFTVMAGKTPHYRVVEILNTLFTEFDRLAEVYGLEKIKTIGDAYMAAGGLLRKDANEESNMAKFALKMQKFMNSNPIPDHPELSIRIGIHTGEAIAGVICENKFAYDVWGDTVNLASRMESHGVANEIHVSSEFYNKTKHEFAFEPRGTLSIKGKGNLETFFLKGEKLG